MKKPYVDPKVLTRKREIDRDKIRGVFRNLEQQGAPIKFWTRLHKDDPIEKWEFEDGKVYEVPLGVAKHINNECKVRSSKWLCDENGKPLRHEAFSRPRFVFDSLEFASIPELDSKLEPIEKTSK